MPPSSDSRPLWFITGDRQGVSTAHFRRASQLATADICLASLNVQSELLVSI